ncbi:MAG: transposase, partial [Pirellulales bacterium]
MTATPHTSRGKSGSGSTGPNCDGFLRIATHRLDLPAELISEMYRLRWLIENFFRMFKQLLGCRHLLSTKPNGVEIQVSFGIIACLLIMLYTGRKPTKRTFEMVCFFLSGWASPEELERHIKALPQPVSSLHAFDDAAAFAAAQWPPLTMIQAPSPGRRPAAPGGGGGG